MKGSLSMIAWRDAGACDLLASTHRKGKKITMAQSEVAMRAIVQDVFGGPEVLHFADVAKPVALDRDVLVRVKAVAVNPVDAKVRGGGPKGSPVPGGSKIVGWDGAGVVEAVGTDVELFRPGDAVYFAGDITRPGSYAEYVAVDERIVGYKPVTLSFEEAAAMPLTTLTAWEGMFEAMCATPSVEGSARSILIVGGAGGVGSIAIQLAKQVCGLKVVATASRDETKAYCETLGADAVINHYADLPAQLQALGMDGVDYVLTTVSLSNFQQLVASLNPLGRICTIVGGPELKTLDVSGLFAIRGSLSFELMFTRPRVGVEPEKQGQILNRLAELLDQKQVISTMSKTVPWTAVQDAHREIESGHTIGKIVMTVA